MHRSSIGVNIAPAPDVLGAEGLEPPIRPSTKNLWHLMLRFAERLAFNGIGEELKSMTEDELRAAVMLYVPHL